MKIFWVALISLFSVYATAGTCGAPLADRTFCAAVNGEEKRMGFTSDCSFAYWSQNSHGDINSFVGTWSIDGTDLTIQTGSEVGTRSLLFSADMNSFSAVGYPNEIYSVCQ